ncbi:M81 family metallopeptidase [Alkalihalobacterium alkalinitrilicum]|uniref:M81 family metallopeptidase n=1 Tax=Alkalihalobacterium alkalinitrilicum TaxID=427920 RepID=UPI000994E466|nr:M81 family metallopeptidase [Alkalihalobacterium alkalinitrilicum]
MKIVIGQVAHETNTFSTIKTTKEFFQLWEWDHGHQIIERHQGVEDYLGGMIDRAKDLKIEIAPSFSAYANPSGLITKETYLQLKKELISSINSIGSFDAICIMLHGAGVAEEAEDLEGELLVALRKQFGYEVPIIVVLDLHANLSQKMVDEADLIIGDNLYPHIDSYDRGKEAIDLTAKILTSDLDPVMYLEKLPLLIPTSTTDHYPAKEINEVCWQWEKNEQVIDCTFYHGFPYSDTIDTGVSVLTVTNNNSRLAEKVSKDVSRKIWRLKMRFTRDYPAPKAGIQEALKEQMFPIVLNETSDNPGAGTPGDGTRLLEALIHANIEKSCFAAIYDPDVAEIAHDFGAGSVINVHLGGKSDSLHGNPLPIRAYVKSVTDGRFTQTSPMWKGIQVDLGKSTRLQVGAVDIIVCSVNTQVMDEQVFLLHGVDIKDYKVVALKSSQHFRATFELIAKKIITIDSPGLSTCNLKLFQYENVRRPIYPMDEMK